MERSRNSAKRSDEDFAETPMSLEGSEFALSTSTGYPQLSGERTWRKDRWSDYARWKFSRENTGASMRDEITIHRASSSLDQRTRDRLTQYSLHRVLLSRRSIGLAALSRELLVDPRGSRSIKNPKSDLLASFFRRMQFARRSNFARTMSLCNFESRSHRINSRGALFAARSPRPIPTIRRRQTLRDYERFKSMEF